MFVAGFLALGQPTGPGQFAELALPGYARQPIAFGDVVDGNCYNVNAYSFGQTVRGYSGRAIYDSPSGGALLLVLPFPTPLAPGRLPWEAMDASTLRLTFTAMQPYHNGLAYTGTILAGAVAGTCNDAADIQNTAQSIAGNPSPIINTAQMTAGVGLTITRGTLAKT